MYRKQKIKNIIFPGCAYKPELGITLDSLASCFTVKTDDLNYEMTADFASNISTHEAGGEERIKVKEEKKKR